MQLWTWKSQQSRRDLQILKTHLRRLLLLMLKMTRLIRLELLPDKTLWLLLILLAKIQRQNVMLNGLEESRASLVVATQASQMQELDHKHLPPSPVE